MEGNRNMMGKIGFENLPKLLRSMEQQGWIIDSFLFRYKEEDYVVILKTYNEKERKPNKYAVAKLEFIKTSDVSNSIHAYCDFYEVQFSSVKEFINFFNIEIKNANRNLFLDFSKIFSKYIPNKKDNRKPELFRKLQGSRCEGNDPTAIYCYDVRRNGKTGGSSNVRTIENSNKARTLRPFLYEKYKEDTNLSFFFSPNPEDSKSDGEIISIVAGRSSNN